MLKKNRLFTPGPTPLLPPAAQAMAAADIHHRTADFRALYKRVLDGLRTFIGTQNDVIVLSSSGTGAMEAAVQNLTSPGDKVLVLTTGKFGERWRDLTKTFGCAVDVISAPYGETFDVKQVRERLQWADVRAVFLQATESSTGARHDLVAVAEAMYRTNALLVVDAITGLGTTQMDVDAWGVDVIIGGSQKALMVPPGLAYMAVSERAWKRMDENKAPRYYFDLRRERKVAAKGESAYTPAIAHIAALAAALDYLAEAGGGDLAAGRDVLIENAETCAAMTRAAAKALGLELFAPKCPAAALTAIRSPKDIEASTIVKLFREKFGAVIAAGQGDEMKNQLFRMAHIGYFDYLDTIGAIGALEQVLAGLGMKIEFGVGVAAAQKVWAEREAKA